MKKAFTMVELVFVIVVIGILAGIAIPRLAVTRDDATIAKLRSDLSAIRSGIALKRSENMMRGQVDWPALETSGASGIFSAVLQNPIKDAGDKARNGWHKIKDDEYQACVAGKCTTFTYTKNGVRDTKTQQYTTQPGLFTCTASDQTCISLTK